MHNLENTQTKQAVEWVVSRDTWLMMLGGVFVPAIRACVVCLCHEDEAYTRVKNKCCFRIVNVG